MSNPSRVTFDETCLVRYTCLCLHLQRAARATARRFDAAFRPFDLTNQQFSLLMSLNRPEPAGIRAVATLLAMDRTTLTAALKPLERRGLVAVTADPADRRGRRLTLTPQGHSTPRRGVAGMAARARGSRCPDRRRRPRAPARRPARSRHDHPCGRTPRRFSRERPALFARFFTQRSSLGTMVHPCWTCVSCSTWPYPRARMHHPRPAGMDGG